jgi:hypothetical protein
MNLPPALSHTPIVFLTGAGASVPLGLPATKGFLSTFRDQVTNTWSQDSPSGYLGFVQDRLSHPDGDIEAVLGSLEQESNWCDILAADLPFVQEVLGGDRSRLLGFKTKIDKLREAIYDEVVRIYGNVDPIKAESLYKGLVGSYMLYFRPLCGGRPTLPFFTLNYDTAVEEAASLLGIRCVDGIRQMAGTSFRRWTADAYADYEPSPEEEVCIVLVKLHGSVRLVERSTVNGPLFVEVPTGLARDPAPNKHVVLYPSLLPKPITTEPFRTGYRLFRASLSNSNTYCLVIIGCSFRDLELNTIVRDALDDNDHLKLVVLDPGLDHETVAQRIGCTPERVHVIQQPFVPEADEDLKNGRGKIMTPLRLWVGVAVGEMNLGNQPFSGTSE